MSLIGVRKIPILSVSKSLLEPVQALFQGGAVDGLIHAPADSALYEERVSPTTPTEIDAVAGWIGDASPNDNNGVPSADSKRSILKASGNLRFLRHDDVDDAYTFDTGFTGEYDVFIGAQIHDANGVLLDAINTTYYFGAYDSGGSSSNTSLFTGVTAIPDIYVNRVEQVSPTRGSFQAALNTGSPVVISILNANISQPLIRFSDYLTGWHSEADLYALVIIEKQSAANRALIEKYVASRCGVTL